jgi:(2Fe-2S) ferredoxin
MPKRERYVFVCTNRRPDDNPKGSCAQKGSEALQQKLKAAVAQAGLHARVRVTTSGCLDLCWVGISVGVMPDMTFFGRVTEDDIPAMVEAFGRPENVAEHPALRSKVVQPNEFDDPNATVKLGVRRPG